MFKTYAFWIALAVASMSAAAISHKITADIYQAKVATEVAGRANDRVTMAQATVAAVNSAVALANKQAETVHAAAIADAQREAAEKASTDKSKQEVIRYVKVNTACVSFGLVRVLDAKALGVSAADLPLPAGVSDETCTSISHADLAQNIIGNYGSYRSVAGMIDTQIATSLAVRTIGSNTNPVVVSP